MIQENQDNVVRSEQDVTI